jgi:hypothetical protein
MDLRDACLQSRSSRGLQAMNRRRISVLAALVLAVASAPVVAIPLSRASAESRSERSDAPAPSSSSLATRRDRVRVQPRVWEFTPPYGTPDLSPESVRELELLYDRLIRRAEPRCSQPGTSTPKTEPC